MPWSTCSYFYSRFVTFTTFCGTMVARFSPYLITFVYISPHLPIFPRRLVTFLHLSTYFSHLPISPIFPTSWHFNFIHLFASFCHFLVLFITLANFYNFHYHLSNYPLRSISDFISYYRDFCHLSRFFLLHLPTFGYFSLLFRHFH